MREGRGECVCCCEHLIVPRRRFNHKGRQRLKVHPTRHTKGTEHETGDGFRWGLYPGSSAGFLVCSACLAVARFTALGPLFFFFRRAAALSALDIFGAGGMPPSIPLTPAIVGPRRLDLLARHHIDFGP